MNHRLLLTASIAASLIGGPSFVEAAETVRPPKPSAFNAELPYYRSMTAEGTLRIRFSVLRTGHVEDWEILEAPSGIEDIQASTRETVVDWEFEPAENAHGRRVAGTYDYVRLFSPEYGYERARAYPKSSAEVTEAFLSVTKALKFNFPKRDVSHGIYITNIVRFSKGRFPGLETPEYILPRKVLFQVYIPQGVEPARVYINTELEAKIVPSGIVMHYYNGGGLEDWLFGKLEEKLETRGHALPRDSAARRALFQELAPGSNDCDQKEPMVPGVDNVSNPVLIKMAKHDLIYPPTARRSKNQAQVILQALVNEDGWVGDIYVIRTNSENIDFVVSTKQTVSFWLYEPARQAGCPVAVYFTVVADFILHN